MAARVLVVEDDEATRGALRALLDDAGYDCDEASDGERAVEVMRDAPFDLVVLDLGLPGMSGADLHRQLRRDPRTRFLPIVFLTAHSDRQVKLAELEAGAEDFITKPYDAEELLARVGAAVRRWSGMRAVNPLSGLPGNPTITEELDARLARGEDFALLYVDIDRFKEFNDHYGFTRGDRVITMLAEILVDIAGTERRIFVRRWMLDIAVNAHRAAVDDAADARAGGCLDELTDADRIDLPIHAVGQPGLPIERGDVVHDVHAFDGRLQGFGTAQIPGHDRDALGAERRRGRTHSDHRSYIVAAPFQRTREMAAREPGRARD